MKYLQWVKTLTCVECGTDQCIDAHHLIGHNRGGLKNPDEFAFPLCRQHHDRLHNLGYNYWEELNGSQWEFVARTLAMHVREHG